jgi:hypothetical protein
MAAPGGSEQVKAMILLTVSSVVGRVPGGRLGSRDKTSGRLKVE